MQCKKSVCYTAGCGKAFKGQQCPVRMLQRLAYHSRIQQITIAPLSQELKIHDFSSQLSCAGSQNSWGWQGPLEICPISLVKAESATAEFFRAVPHHILMSLGRVHSFNSDNTNYTTVCKWKGCSEYDSEERRADPTKLNKPFPVSGPVLWVFAMPPVFVLLAPVWL